MGADRATGRADLQMKTDMKTNAPTETPRVIPVVRDDGHYAARVVMLSTLILFTFIFVLQAIAP